MFGRKKPQVLIVGAGPVGLFAALVLTRRGIRVQIVDAEWRTGAHSYALALHSYSLKLLEKVGLLEDVLEKSYRVRTIGLYDRTSRRAELRISDLSEDFSFLAVIPQNRFESLLEKALDELGVKVRWCHEVVRLEPSAEQVEATVQQLEKESFGYSISHSEWIVAKTYNLQVPFVIGADGHHSLTRSQLEIEFAARPGIQHFAVFEFTTGWNAGKEMRLTLGDGLVDVLWPLPGGKCRWSFQLTDVAAPENSRLKDVFEMQAGKTRYPALTESHLRELLDERASWFDGNVDDIGWRILVRFDRRLADAFGRDRIWLAGDAAHMTGPAGVQSMNVGLREAYDLANVMADILLDEASFDALDSYNRSRLHEWEYLLDPDGGLESTVETDPWIRDHAHLLLPCMPASGMDLDLLVSQIGLKTRPYVAV